MKGALLAAVLACSAASAEAPDNVGPIFLTKVDVLFPTDDPGVWRTHRVQVRWQPDGKALFCFAHKNERKVTCFYKIDKDTVATKTEPLPGVELYQ